MIEGRHIKIRAFEERDIEVIFNLFQKSVIKAEIYISEFESKVKLKELFLKNGLIDENIAYFIIANLQDEIIGLIYFKKPLAHLALDIGFIIFEEKNRAKGYMKESLKLFSRYIFSTRNINRLQLSIPDYNRAAIAVAQGCNFSFEGIAKQALFFKGELLDLCVYSLLRKDVE